MAYTALRPSQASARTFGSTSALREGMELDFEIAAQLDPKTTAFFFDVDGTLIDIASHPDAVEVPASLISHLEMLATRADGAVALVSGREADVLDRLFTPLTLPLSGVHGAQMRAKPGEPLSSVMAPLDEGVRAALCKLTEAFDELHIEDKGFSVALHYRNRPAIAAELEEAIARVIAPQARSLTVLPGRMVFEVKHRGHDKGVAVRAFMAEAPFAGRTPVFFGDDVTDEAGFAAVRELGGLAISVGRRLPGADVVLSDAEMVRALIRRLVNPAEGRD